MITGYIIERCEDGTDKWLRCNARLCPDLSYRVFHATLPLESGLVSKCEDSAMLVVMIVFRCRA